VPDSDIKDFGGLHYPIEKPKMFQKLKEKLLDPKFTVDERVAPVKISGKISYVEQSPWIQNKTIRDNICFGLPLDHEKYVKTVMACQLERDLEILPAGDTTEIGEKGINLSGG